jgi:hypothetical protein
MRTRIVLAPQNAEWVIGKIAHRLSDALNALGHEADVSDIADERADINHWMSFAFADGCSRTLNSMFVTHADDPYKVRLICERLSGPIQLALCMSPHAAEELAELGAAADRLWYVLPAMDQVLQPRRVVIGITTRVYDDGRKRESFLRRLAAEMPLTAFRFLIFGSGWEPVVADLRRAGAEVELDPGGKDWRGDYERIQSAVPHFDYYLSMGMDEGSLGTLDAASAGVRTIVTAQGFHRSLPGGIDHPILDYADLRSIFTQIAARIANAGAYRQWSWETYGREHAAIWSAMMTHRGASVPRAELEAAMLRQPAAAAPSGREGRISARGLRFGLRMFAPRRVRGAIARVRWLQPLRRLVKR